MLLQPMLLQPLQPEPQKTMEMGVLRVGQGTRQVW